MSKTVTYGYSVRYAVGRRRRFAPPLPTARVRVSLPLFYSGYFRSLL